MNTTLFSAAAEVLAESISEALNARELRQVVADDGEVHVIFEHNGCEIKTVVGEFWAHPNEICYFVNVSHPNGNFMLQPGTPNALTAAINIGKAIHFANVSGNPIECEDR